MALSSSCPIVEKASKYKMSLELLLSTNNLQILAPSIFAVMMTVLEGGSPPLHILFPEGDMLFTLQLLLGVSLVLMLLAYLFLIVKSFLQLALLRHMDDLSGGSVRGCNYILVREGPHRGSFLSSFVSSSGRGLCKKHFKYSLLINFSILFLS